MEAEQGISADAYASAGVSVAAGRELAQRIGQLTGSGQIPGSFAAVLDLPGGMADPVMLACCDGVGTKLKLLREHSRLTNAGVDLVAMCVNDLLCHGGMPAYFLDYYGCSRLDMAEAEQILAGIVRACKDAGCRLVGGETAQLPGTIAPDAFDLAGFAVGFAERRDLLGPARVRSGDAVIAIESAGPHSNGYSLIRRILAECEASAEVMAALLAPTHMYVHAVQGLLAAGGLHALAHISGGGLAGNLARAVPAGLCAQLDASALEMPPAFAWLASAGELGAEEMRTVFNCGIGMAAIVEEASAPGAMAELAACGLRGWQIGAIADGDRRVAVR